MGAARSCAWRGGKGRTALSSQKAIGRPKLAVEERIHPRCADPVDRAHSVGRQLEIRFARRAPLHSGVGEGLPEFSRALRHRHHQRRQRHIPFVVRPGSGRRAARRDGCRDDLSRYRLVRAPDDQEARRNLRRGERTGDLSDSRVEEAVGSAAQDDIRRGRRGSRIHSDSTAADLPARRDHAQQRARVPRAR